MELSPSALIVLRRRYLRRDEQRNVIETPGQMFERVARAVARADLIYSPTANWEATASDFYDVMSGLEFLPNSPTLANAGTELGQLMACFVLPIEDSLESIFDTLKHAAIIQKSGGGTGFSFSRIRPKGDIVRSTMGIASGPISFLLIYDRMTEVIKQGSIRRGANMGILRVDHPDIIEFITVKRDPRVLTNFNLSVAITDAFMTAVAADEEYDLINPRSGLVSRRLRAREVWDLIARMAWETGEPGVIFLDRINRDNPTPLLGQMEATNPCSEQPLLPYEACVLGSLNLARMVKEQDGRVEVDYDKLGRRVELAVHYLDNIVDINRYPLPQIERLCKGNRKIGLGVMGFADLLIKLGIPYDSPEALARAEDIMRFIRDRARQASAALAEERGVFPNFPGSIYDRPGGPRLRNATLTTIAPTGTLSIIANCSGGIEPLFALSYIRRILEGEELPQQLHPIFHAVAQRRSFAREPILQRVMQQGTLRGIEEIPEDVRRIFVTAFDVAPEWHVRMQAAFQKYVDNAVSKTVNLPTEATVDDVRRVFDLAYELNCKGVTVYRYGSRPSQVLSVQAYCLNCTGEDGLPQER